MSYIVSYAVNFPRYVEHLRMQILSGHVEFGKRIPNYPLLGWRLGFELVHSFEFAAPAGKPGILEHLKAASEKI